MASAQRDRTKHLPAGAQRQSGVVQESKLTAQSRSPKIQNYTLVRHDRRLGPGGGLLICIHNSVNFARKLLSTPSKNDPHIDELTISITMDNTELLITNVYTPGKLLQLVLFSTTRPHADRHRLTSAGRLQCSPFTQALRNNRYERQPTGGFNQYFQICSLKLRFSYKASSEFRHQFSGCIISISLSDHLVRMSSDHLHIIIRLQITANSSPARQRTFINLK